MSNYTRKSKLKTNSWGKVCNKTQDVSLDKLEQKKFFVIFSDFAHHLKNKVAIMYTELIFILFVYFHNRQNEGVL